MPNQENKKNGPVDYSKFFEQEREKPETEEIISNKKKKSFLSIFRNFWGESDKKIKIQIIVFLVIIFLTIIILSSYWLRQNSGEFGEPIIYISYSQEKNV